MYFEHTTIKHGSHFICHVLHSQTLWVVNSTYLPKSTLFHRSNVDFQSPVFTGLVYDIIIVARVTLIVGLPHRLTSIYIISTKISSKILHFLPARLAGWNNKCHPASRFHHHPNIVIISSAQIIRRMEFRPKRNEPLVAKMANN